MEVGGFGLRYYSVLFLASLVLGFLLLFRDFERLQAPVEEAGDFAAYGWIAVMCGARLGHVLFYDLDRALEDPLWIFEVWTGGLSSHGALLGLIVAAFWFCHRRGLSTFQLIDLLVRPLLLGGALMRLGAFFNSEGVGRITTSSWGMRFPRYDFSYAEVPLRHPTQLYEAAMCLFLLVVITSMVKKLRSRAAGLLGAAGLGLYSVARFLVEFFKEYQTLPAHFPLTMGQYLSLGGLLIAVAMAAWALRRNEPAGWVTSSPGPDSAERAAGLLA